MCSYFYWRDADLVKKIKKFAEGIDKSPHLWYSIIRKREQEISQEKGKKVMKYRVVFKDGKYWPTYFKTKRAAVLFQEQVGGEIQRKIGGNWCDY